MRGKPVWHAFDNVFSTLSHVIVKCSSSCSIRLNEFQSRYLSFQCRLRRHSLYFATITLIRTEIFLVHFFLLRTPFPVMASFSVLAGSPGTFRKSKTREAVRPGTLYIHITDRNTLADNVANSEKLTARLHQ